MQMIDDNHYSFSRVWFSISIPTFKRRTNEEEDILQHKRKYRSVSFYAWQSYKNRQLFQIFKYAILFIESSTLS